MSSISDLIGTALGILNGWLLAFTLIVCGATTIIWLKGGGPVNMIEMVSSTIGAATGINNANWVVNYYNADLKAEQFRCDSKLGHTKAACSQFIETIADDSVRMCMANALDDAFSPSPVKAITAQPVFKYLGDFLVLFLCIVGSTFFSLFATAIARPKATNNLQVGLTLALMLGVFFTLMIASRPYDNSNLSYGKITFVEGSSFCGYGVGH